MRRFAFLNDARRGSKARTQFSAFYCYFPPSSFRPRSDSLRFKLCASHERCRVVVVVVVVVVVIGVRNAPCGLWHLSPGDECGGQRATVAARVGLRIHGPRHGHGVPQRGGGGRGGARRGGGGGGGGQRAAGDSHYDQVVAIGYGKWRSRRAQGIRRVTHCE